jgi:hypothetical protein
MVGTAKPRAAEPHEAETARRDETLVGVANYLSAHPQDAGAWLAFKDRCEELGLRRDSEVMYGVLLGHCLDGRTRGLRRKPQWADDLGCEFGVAVWYYESDNPGQYDSSATVGGTNISIQVKVGGSAPVDVGLLSFDQDGQTDGVWHSPRNAPEVRHVSGRVRWALRHEKATWHLCPDTLIRETDGEEEFEKQLV